LFQSGTTVRHIGDAIHKLLSGDVWTTLPSSSRDSGVTWLAIGGIAGTVDYFKPLAIALSRNRRGIARVVRDSSYAKFKW
jgi:hypothetical protein